MVTHHHRVAVGRQILQTVHLHLESQVPRFLALGEAIDKIEAEQIAVLVDGLVDFVDMQQTLTPSQHKTGHLDALVGQNFLQINMLLGDNYLFHPLFALTIQTAKIQLFFYIGTIFFNIPFLTKKSATRQPVPETEFNIKTIKKRIANAQKCPNTPLVPTT